MCGSVLLIAATVLAVGWLLVLLAPVTLAVVAALLLAALLIPGVNILVRLRFPRAAAALAAVVGLLAALILPLFLVGQQAAGQFDNLGRSLREGIARVRRWVAEGPLPVTGDQLDRLWPQARDAALDVVPGPAGGVSMATQVVGAAALAVVLLFFILKDGEAMWAWVLRRIPPRQRRKADDAAHGGWHTLVGYVRGTVLIAVADAVGVGVALLLVGVPLALPLALLTFLAAFIPIVGATVAGAAAVLVALVANGPTDALIILAAILIVQQVEGNLLQPFVMGHAVRLHPAVILVAVAAGTVLAGVAGAVVAVPLTAVAYRVVSVLTDTDSSADDDDTDTGDEPSSEEPPSAAGREATAAPDRAD
ncbi:AI-2E family transporter [Spirilliplanes yamanashiensis]|uniref:AI-2E family transporter n=1 Tax=Spirilliplanes yamanashiensis TaxID=42233 RepID=UPI00195129A5|nr:AI-2E family transporter [Spirilliplanes yamanashiensis]MDP9816795.1 putative PurR-regulated permease PerM [Spirilliplanes yamanashiensis]